MIVALVAILAGSTVGADGPVTETMVLKAEEIDNRERVKIVIGAVSIHVDNFVLNHPKFPDAAVSAVDGLVEIRSGKSLLRAKHVSLSIK
jgi:hypothetical protein